MGQRAETGTQEVPHKRAIELVYCEDDRALEQPAQRGCGVSSLEIFKSLLDIILDNLHRVSLLELRVLDQTDPEVPANYSVIL